MFLAYLIFNIIFALIVFVIIKKIKTKKMKNYRYTVKVTIYDKTFTCRWGEIIFYPIFLIMLIEMIMLYFFLKK